MQTGHPCTDYNGYCYLAYYCCGIYFLSSFYYYSL